MDKLLEVKEVAKSIENKSILKGLTKVYQRIHHL